MRVLITGATGFVGGHLVEALGRHGAHELHGLSRSAAFAPGWSHLRDRVTLHAADLADDAATESVLRRVEPEWVFHLAGYANAGKSFTEPDAAWRGNLGVTRVLYDAVAKSGRRPRILYVGTGLVYGDAVPGKAAFDEDCALQPASPYSASKAAADLLSYQVTRSPGLDVIRVRPFNQTGPGQTPDYAVPAFARQIAAIEQGRQSPVVETGDLSAERDLTDVRDMADAYVLLMEHGATGEAYNAATGVTHRMSAVLELLVAQAKVRVEVRSKVDPSRKGDTAVTRADVSKIKRVTGWRPRHSLEQTLRDTLESWRVGSSASGAA